MPFDASIFPAARAANRNERPAQLDLRAAFDRVPQVRRPVREHVLVPDLNRTAPALAEAYEWESARASVRMWGWVFLFAAVMYVGLGSWLAFEAVQALFDAARYNAADAVSRGAW